MLKWLRTARYRWVLGGQTLRTLRILEASQRRGMYTGAKDPSFLSVLAQGTGELFRTAGGPDYLECHLVCEVSGTLILTVQRKDGKSPHELRCDAEAQRDHWQREVEAQRDHWQREAELSQKLADARIAALSIRVNAAVFRGCDRCGCELLGTGMTMTSHGVICAACLVDVDIQTT